MKMIWTRSHLLARGLALLGFTGLLILALMTTTDVLMRWLFKAPIQGVNDVSSVVMAVVIAACIPANLAMKQNIRVEVFGSLGGKTLHRLLEALSSALTLLFILLIAWEFVPYAASLQANGDRTWVLGWPVWPWWSVAALMMWLAAFVQAMVFVFDLAALVRGRASGLGLDTDAVAVAPDDTGTPL
ncbi:TRAP transporter small permease [Pseudooceanicola spongiae]|uniref:TRAP transporter small permease protein n=1 Tax=Pseudooceanicola spongiae TaxID=2613965 RepID=A0A7L9WPD9_9RHOB|nr:TRAP transporter small permease [Pseudooceanicola spongiae]QOL80970.1 TRAP transporter small permease subunit [Pseudooceanicola spongiae]